MGVGFFHSPDESKIHADLRDWLDKAQQAVAGQTLTGIFAEGNDIILQFANGRALVFVNPRGKGVGQLVAKMEMPESDPASN